MTSNEDRNEDNDTRAPGGRSGDGSTSYGPEIDREPEAQDGETPVGMDEVSDPDDPILQQLSLRMDGRLNEADERDLARLLGESEAAREIERDLLSARALLLTEADPAIPVGLLQRTLDRVAASRERERESVRVLRLTRGLALAAAIALVGTLFAYSNPSRTVGAAPQTQEPTVEDRLDHGLLDFLKQHFLGHSRDDSPGHSPATRPESGAATEAAETHEDGR